MEMIKRIKIDNPDEIVNELKKQASGSLKMFSEGIIREKLPKRIDYDSYEDYQIERTTVLMKLLSEVEELKRLIFVSELNAYNNFLRSFNEFKHYAKMQNNNFIESIEKVTGDMISAGIVTIALTVIFPYTTPIVLFFNIPRIGMDAFTRKINKMRINDNIELEKKLKNLQEPLYEFTDTLRTDYHRSKKEIKELRERLKEGEDITEELIKIASPKRIGLDIVEEEQKEKTYHIPKHLAKNRSN